MKNKRIKNFIKKILLVDEGPKPLFSRKHPLPITSNMKAGFEICNFGNLNKDKIFYVIRRTSHAGIFSYLSFILNHIKIAKQNNFIPIVDMENFTSPYNEEKKILNTNNAWEYYFHQTDNYSLDEVYSSQNVIFSRTDFHHKMEYRIHLVPEFREFKNKEINLLKDYTKFVDKFFVDNELLNKKILGIHFRGTSYKTSRGHIFPATKKQIKNEVNKLLDKDKFDKIYLCTEEQQYLDFFKKNYSNKLIFIDTFRSNKNDAFVRYPRNNHRHLLGDEAVKEALILSKCHSLLFVRSNIINAANYFADKKQNLYEIFNGFNSRNQFIARWLWYIKKELPKNLLGLKKDIIISKN
jgi:hypothetical protein